MSQLKPFRQFPIWSNEENFEISGTELRAIENISEAFTKFLPTLENILMRNLMNGKITVRYEDLEGREIPKEEILKMYESYMKEQQAPISEEPTM